MGHSFLLLFSFEWRLMWQLTQDGLDGWLAVSQARAGPQNDAAGRNDEDRHRRLVHLGSAGQQGMHAILARHLGLCVGQDGILEASITGSGGRLSRRLAGK